MRISFLFNNRCSYFYSLIFSGNSRSKILRNKILFTRSQEERERIITEKVAIILVETDDQDIKMETRTRAANLKSKFLRQYRDEVRIMIFTYIILLGSKKLQNSN